MNDFDALKKAFLTWELKANLDDYEIKGLLIWPFFRLNFFQILSNSEMSLKSIKEVRKSTNNEKTLKSVIGVSFNAFKYLFSKKEKVTSLCFTSVLNSVNLQENYSDKYFDYIMKGNKDYLLVEMPYPPQLHYVNHNMKEHRVYGDILFFVELLFPFVSFKETKKIHTMVGEIFDSFNKLYVEIYKKEIQINSIKLLVISTIQRALKRKVFFKKFIENHQPKEILVKSAYDPFNLVLQNVAKENNIKFIELQHSHIYPFHFGYVKNPDLKNTWFPDKIYAFNDLYSNILVKDCFWDNDEIEIKGNFLLKKKVELINKRLTTMVSKYNVVITVVNQYSITDSFIDFLKQAHRYPKILFLIKLHPMYEDIQIKQYQKIKGKNIKIIKNTTLEEVLGYSNAAVGVYSSGLVDAKKLKKEVFILNHELSVYYKNFIKDKKFIKIDTIQNIVDYYENS